MQLGFQIHVGILGLINGLEINKRNDAIPGQFIVFTEMAACHYFFNYHINVIILEPFNELSKAVVRKKTNVDVTQQPEQIWICLHQQENNYIASSLLLDSYCTRVALVCAHPREYMSRCQSIWICDTVFHHFPIQMAEPSLPVLMEDLKSQISVMTSNPTLSFLN